MDMAPHLAGRKGGENHYGFDQAGEELTLDTNMFMPNIAKHSGEKKS